MDHILDDGRAGVLADYVRSKPLLAFDFDGTLAPIVSERNEARMRESTAVLLGAVCTLLPTAVISGRDRADLFDRLPSSTVKHVIGNHGLEPAPGMRWFAREVGLMHSELSMRLLPHTECEIENKLCSLAIHYRHARHKRETRAAILRASAKLRSRPRIVLGKYVVNLLPAGAPDKGVALQELCVREGAATAIYIGDDDTDEDAFALSSSGRVLAIRVGCDRASAAPYFLRDQSEIDALLRRIIALRQEGVPQAAQH